jgi:uncharacterized protein (DUF433 family)
MAVASSVDIGTLITKSLEIWHGRPVIAGTRVTVMGIVALYQEGLTPEQIADQKYLSLAQVYAALTYYHANRLEIENDIEEEQAEYDKAAKEYYEKHGRNKRT